MRSSRTTLWWAAAIVLGVGGLVLIGALGGMAGSGHPPTTRATSAGRAQAQPSPSSAAAGREAAPLEGEWREPYFPFLDDESAEASVSVGSTSHGHVVNSQPLLEGDAWSILPPHRSRHLNWGTGEVIALLQCAAKTLHQRTGTRLWIGNIGKRGGGDISYSVSHNSGRDVDVAFCYQNRAGEPLDPPDLVPLNGAGIGRRGGGFRLDVARTWMVVRALLECPDAQVQYVFIDQPLKRLLIDYADGQGEPASVRKKAAAVLRHPWGAAAHDDHMHVRLYCSKRDMEGGCEHAGDVHPWVELHEDDKAARIATVAQRLTDEAPLQRRRAIERLVLLQAQSHLTGLAARLDDAVADVRHAAARALGALGPPSMAGPLIARFDIEPDLEVRLALLDATSEVGGSDAGQFLRTLIATEPPLGLVGRAWELVVFIPPLTLLPLAPTAPAPTQLAGWAEHALWHQLTPESSPLPTAARTVRLAAIEGAGRSERLEPLDVLVPLLEHYDPEVRQRAARALRWITNRSFDVRWDDPSTSPAALRRAARRWQRWVKRHRGLPRDRWLAAGFSASGFRVKELRQQYLWELVRAVAGADHHSHNAQKVLMRLTEHHPPSLDWPRHKSCGYWLRWLRGRRATYRLGRPPSRVQKACSGR